MRVSIREHEWNTIGRCQHCGAVLFATLQQWCRDNHKSAPETDERECLWRQKAGSPEPRRRQYAYDDAETISARIEEIRRQEEPKCPQNGDRRLYECLRSAAACSEACPLHLDWIGPG